MRFFLTGFAALYASAAMAQIEAPAAPADEGGEIDQFLEELSELERLSRSAEDPFANVIQRDQRKPISVTLRALDKITARYTDIEIAMHEIARFGALELQPRFCDKRPPEEFPETTVFLEVYDIDAGSAQSDLRPGVAIAEEPAEAETAPDPSAEPGPTSEAVLAAMPRRLEPAPEVLDGPQAEGVNIFRGWMFASSPALNALEHPVYDVWVIDCKTALDES